MNRSEAARILLATYFDGGCIRWRDQARQKAEGARKYKKGYEVRLPAGSEEEADEVLAAIEALELKSGRPYAKSRQVIIPVYGKRQVEFLYGLLEGKPP